MKGTIIVVALVTGAALVGPMDTAQAQTAMPDATFVEHATADNAAVIELGDLAGTRANDPAVRRYADRIVVDHRAAGADLKALAARKGWQIPTQHDPQHLATRDRLMTVSGSEFDRRFVEVMVKDHDHVILEFETAATTATDAELRNWAQQILPVLREHRYIAQDLSQQLTELPAAMPRSAVVDQPWCGGAYGPARGTNFANCPR